jgi:hypothetical protein
MDPSSRSEECRDACFKRHGRCRQTPQASEQQGCCRPIQGWMLHIHGRMLRVAGQYKDVRIEAAGVVNIGGNYEMANYDTKS